MRPRLADLFRRPIAHRGLWSPSGPPENSLAAFRAAAGAGYAIELDVRLSADGVPVVFHDADLKRMTGQAGDPSALTARELAHLSLAGSDQTIPTLTEALDAVGTGVAVFVELKSTPVQEGALETRTARLAATHRGPVALISFNPTALAVAAEAAPGVPRGLTGSDHVTHAAHVVARGGFAPFSAADLEHAQPDFLLPGKTLLAREGRALRRFGLPLVTWTLRASTEVRDLAPLCDAWMFEGFAA
ncbi:glycerophosphodiester phosphodiesterase family protein [Brevundimonas sp. 2R-24]|uniref:Glycerophosphodiester phosphodiesterase family protein n=1 Tax=Peiella sedimenti TaxID=3061083 RepID=A0ABT8SKF1_9CAUL|nr:glycerophosphodiester phosphodiesterase family protein [Caulobacteraceae bacterium XZ-24]